MRIIQKILRTLWLFGGATFAFYFVVLYFAYVFFIVIVIIPDDRAQTANGKYYVRT